MTPQPKATDAEIEIVLQAMIPELRSSLKTVMQDHSSIDCFECAKGINKRTGHKTSYTCFIAHQFAASILEGTMRGIGESVKAQIEAYQIAGGKQ